MGDAGFVAATTTGPNVEASAPPGASAPDGELPAPLSAADGPSVASLAPVPAWAGLVAAWSPPVAGEPGPVAEVLSAVATTSGSVMASTAPLSGVPGWAVGAAAASRAAQTGQAYLWTRCSQTNKDAGCQSSCSLVSTPMGTRT